MRKKPYIIKIVKDGFRCLRCGHEWEGKEGKFKTKGEQPRICPACKSAYWNQEREV